VVGQFSPVASADVIGFVDASTKDGFGGVFLDRSSGAFLGFSRQMSEEERALSFRDSRESTAYLELLGILEWLMFFAPRCEGRRVLLMVDNSTALRAVNQSYSKTESLAPLILTARRAISDHFISLRTRYIHTSLNAIADALSHLQVEVALCHALRLFGRLFTLLSSPPTSQQQTRS
jgi:hypothetical protein